MSPDVREVLREAASQPSNRPPVERIVRRGRELQRGRLLAGALVLVGVAFGSWQVSHTELFSRAERAVPPAERDQEAEEVTLATLHLPTNVSKEVPWPDGVLIPFGPDREQLGADLSSGGARVFPDSFAIAPDGTFWVTDFLKHRIAHYSTDGDFLGDIEVPDSPVGSKRALLDDIAFVGDRMFIGMYLCEGRIAEVNPSTGELTRLRIRYEGQTVCGGYLASNRGELYIDGEADLHSDGIFRVDLETGEATLVPGVLLDERNRVDWDDYDPASRETQLSLRYEGPESWVQPLDFDAVVERDGKKLGGRLDLVAESLVPTEGRAAAMVMIVVNKGGESEGGQWILELKHDGDHASYSWVALPEQVDTACCRHVSWGPDGSLYVMLMGTDGMTIAQI